MKSLLEFVVKNKIKKSNDLYYENKDKSAVYVKIKSFDELKQAYICLDKNINDVMSKQFQEALERELINNYFLIRPYSIGKNTINIFVQSEDFINKHYTKFGEIDINSDFTIEYWKKHNWNIPE